MARVVAGKRYWKWWGGGAGSGNDTGFGNGWVGQWRWGRASDSVWDGDGVAIVTMFTVLWLVRIAAWEIGWLFLEISRGPNTWERACQHVSTSPGFWAEMEKIVHTHTHAQTTRRHIKVSIPSSPAKGVVQEKDKKLERHTNPPSSSYRFLDSKNGLSDTSFQALKKKTVFWKLWLHPRQVSQETAASSLLLALGGLKARGPAGSCSCRSPQSWWSYPDTWPSSREYRSASKPSSVGWAPTALTEQGL